jgi:hypothetical protein
MVALPLPHTRSRLGDRAAEAQPALEKASIVIVPSSERYFTQMEQLIRDAYGMAPGEVDPASTAEKFRMQAQVFPEGQFIAVDTRTDRVVGLTASMRIDFDPSQPLLESWNHTTNYG